ncbi:ESX secretion-associated protein EspG [Nocardia flavorosea]|uniref:ESX secretion-associated protein EspG n=1 Tax=Nocardia flavorosea TaxID=53429 RepID=UPI002B4ADC95|nr:ESX secretion-associated protein EspG [Nocardia flavorosea]
MTSEPRRWSFTDIEFYALWSERTGGRLPFPLRYTARTADPDRFRRDMRQARNELRDRLGTAFEPALTALTAPDIRIGIGGSDHRDPDDPKSPTRLIGVRRESRGVVVRTLPDENFWYSGGFTVVECDAVRLAEVMVANMPPCEMGKQSEVILPARSPAAVPDRSLGGPAVHDSFAPTPAQRSAAFLAVPAERAGTIHVEQGSSIYGPRGIARFQLEWRDLVDDGRYLIRDSDPPVAVAADASVFTGTINSKIAQIVRVIKDERQRR